MTHRYEAVYKKMVDLHNQGVSPSETSRILEKDGVHASAAAIEIYLEKIFGYCYTHYKVKQGGKCPGCES